MDRWLNRVVTIQKYQKDFYFLLCSITNKWGMGDETSKEEREFCKCSVKTGEKTCMFKKLG